MKKAHDQKATAAKTSLNEAESTYSDIITMRDTVADLTEKQKKAIIASKTALLKKMKVDESLVSAAPKAYEKVLPYCYCS